MKTNVLFFIGVAISSWQATAQTWPFQLWHEGKIILEKGDTLRGSVRYNMQQDIVEFNKQGNMLGTFTPRKVLYFEIFDVSVRKYRQFYSLPYSFTGAYNTSVFFELLHDGKISLLAREALEIVTYNSPYYISGYSRQVLVNHFFIMNQKGEISPVNGEKKDLLKLMGDKGDDVANYIRLNKLDYTNKYDLVRIFEYYNSLLGS